MRLFLGIDGGQSHLIRTLTLLAALTVTFGGLKKNRLFITATTSLYAIYLNRRGVQWP